MLGGVLTVVFIDVALIDDRPAATQGVVETGAVAALDPLAAATAPSRRDASTDALSALAPAVTVTAAVAAVSPSPVPPTETPVPPTETAVPRPTETLVPATPIPPPPTETPLLPTATAAPPTPTAEPPTPTPVPPTPTQPPPTPTPVPPTTTATPAPDEAEGPADAPTPIAGSVTPYSDSLDGNPLGCGGTYDLNDPSVVAVSLERNLEWPCGMPLAIWGPAGQVVAIRQDTCPGCGADHLDLSRAAFDLVCGAGASACEVVILPLPEP